MLGYKMVIVLVWLTIPVSGYCMLRTDYERYLDALNTQRADCIARVSRLQNYTSVMARRASRVAYITDTESRLEWQRTWTSDVRLMDNEAGQLRLMEPAHFPATDAVLLALEKQLAEQQSAVEEAVRYRDMYNKAGSGLVELARDIEHAEGVAAYYKRIGAEGIYLLIMEDLAMIESRYKDQLRERKRLSGDAAYSLERADRLSRDIKRELNHIDEKIAADEQQTYEQELRERFDSFDLKLELKALLASTDSMKTAGRNTSPAGRRTQASPRSHP